MSTTPITKPRGVDLVADPPPMTPQTRNMVLAIGAQALFTHAAHYGLPAPVLVDLETDVRRPAEIRVTIQGVGNQQRWLNTVHLDEVAEDHAPTRSVFRWQVRLPETGTRITLVGVRVDIAAVTR